MKSSPGGDITSLLRSWSDRDPAAEENLWPRVFAELKRLARRHLANQPPDHTLQSGALLNEVYLRFAELRNTRWENRAQFFALCSHWHSQPAVAGRATAVPDFS